MNVTVALPMYNTGNTVFKLLDSLRHQSYKKFNMLLVYKEWPGCKDMIGRIKEYKDLEMDFARQDAGRFEEALNTIYRKADGDIVIHTDDDAYASKDWIKEHVELHRRHKGIGIATGIVDESTFSDGTPLPFLTRLLNEQKWRMNKHTIIDRPIDERFRGYGMYIGKSGMLVDTGIRYNLIKTFKQHGVNMSWKRDALHEFRLPGYTKQGGRNEAAAALEVLERGFLPVWFEGGEVFHPLQRSDSRSASIGSLPVELTAESVLFSYYVSKRYAVDLNALRTRVKLLDDPITKVMTAWENKGYAIGYSIAKEAVMHNWPPKRVRTALIKAIQTGG